MQAPTALLPGKKLSREYLLFDRFRTIAAQSPALWIDSRFWTIDVLQHAHSQPAIWQGCLAIAALNWAWQSRTTYDPGAHELSTTLTLSDEATTHYRKAMRLAQDMRDPAQALVLTLVLSATTSMTGWLGESRLHLAAGRRILRELGPKRQKHMRRSVETLVRLDFDAMSVGDVNAPYESLDLPELRYDAVAVDSIMDYEQAIDCMHRMIRGCMLLDEMTPGSVQPAAHLTTTLRRWEERIAVVEGGKASNLLPSSRLYAPMLMARVYHALLHITMIMSGGGSEMRFDNYTDLFIRHILLVEEMIRHSKKTARSSTMEAGLVTSLFVTGSRCRHPWARRRALKLLENLNRQEGLWRSDAVAAAVRKLMEIEESGSTPRSTGSSTQDTKDQVSCAGTDDVYLGEPISERLRREINRPWDYWSEPDAMVSSNEHWDGVVRIPEQHRFKGIQTSIEAETRRLHMSIFMASDSDDGSLQRHEIEVPF